ncbi:MAG: cupredoxin domain-containing protein, partial [Thermomicrobiales bacterium]|nr:cupredoxin domain-containing protein [Thermomicrobiales bacterium]
MESDGDIDRTGTRRWLVRAAAGLAVFGGIGGVGAVRWASASDDDDDDDNRDHRHGHDDDDDKDRHDRDDRDDDDRRPSQPAAPEENDEHRVEIIDEEFVPASITINAGEWVTWFNLDDDEHTATGRGFDTGELDEGDWTQLQFSTPGTYPYVCQFHPEMLGEVIVLGDAATPQASPEAQASPIAGGERVEVS